MIALDIENRLNELCSQMTFDFKGRSCGIDPLSHSQFDMWYGEHIMTAKNIEEVMTTPFFGGMALQDIVSKIENVDM